MSNSHNATSGLAKWRQRQAEERRLRLEELAHYRADATTEERDGRTYTVVTPADDDDAEIPF